MPKLTEKFQAKNYTALEIGNARFRFNGIPDGAADPNEAVSRATIETLARVDEALAERERLARDDRFTPVGRQEKLQATVAKLASTEVDKEAGVDANLARIAGYIPNFRQGLTEARQKLDKSLPRAETEADVARDAERRSFLREQEPRERNRIVNRAVAEGNEGWTRAVLDADPELVGISPEIQEDLRERYVREKNPELIQEIEAREKAVDHLERTLETAQEALRAIASEPVPDAEEAGAAA